MSFGGTIGQQTMPSTARPNRILIIRPSALGDVCKSVPVLVSLRRAFPDAVIDWLVQDSFTPAIAAHPALSGVVLFPRKALGASMGRLNPGPSLAWMNELRARHYDIAFDMQGLARSGLFAFATRAPRRVGYANARELGWLGYTERHRVGLELHSVDRMLELLKLAGVPPVADMRLYVPESDRAAFTASDSSTASLARQRYVLIAPTSRWVGKRWPCERFAELARELLAVTGPAAIDRVVVVGSASEREQCGPLLELARNQPRVLDLLGKTSVGGLMALVESASLVVANDSAALHMAVGFGRSLVALYGPTRVGTVGPYRRHANVIQHVRPEEVLDHKSDAAGRAMMERITTPEVFDLCRADLISRT